MDAESGNITIKKSSDDSTVETVDVTGDKASGSGSTEITIDPSTTLGGSTGYYITIDASAFDDSSSNSYAGISDAATLNFTTADIAVPTLSSSSPSDGATGIGVNANLVLTFSEAVDAESGNITIKKSSDDSTVEIVDVTGDKASGSGSTEITIDPSTTLDGSTGYYITIDASAFDDSSSNSNAGISDATTLNFTTADIAAPTLSSSSPSDGATGIGVNANLVLTFSEAVDAESGNITIKKSSDDSTVETVDVTGDKASGSGSTEITIDPSTTLDGSTGYYITIDASAFDDSSSNSYAGISDATTLNFTTADIAAPTLTFSPANSASGIAPDADITITFNEAIRNTDDTDLTNANVDSLITLKDTNSNGSDVAFDASIDSAYKVVTINPSSDFSSQQTIYVAIGSTVEDASGNAISPDSATFQAAASNTPLTLTFSPASSAIGVAISRNITLTFDKAVRNTDDTNLTNANVDSLITLKDTNSSGSDIAFNATIDSTQKTITVNPSSDFLSEQTVYVAIGETVEDFFDNSISATSAIFAVADTTAPTAVFDPDDLETAVAVGANITITFNELVRHTDNTALDDSNVDSLITVKDTDSSGSDIAFDATVDNANKIITINPSSDFSSEQTVYVAIGGTLEDSSGNLITATSATFNAADTTPPAVSFTPQHSATGVAVNSDITIAFDEKVQHTDDTVLTDRNVDSLITLKQNNSSGSDIPFDAVVDAAKQLITITLTNSFSSEQTVYLAIGATLEDQSGNANIAASATFTTADATAPSVSFLPPDSSSGIPITSNVVLTFSEAVRRPDNVTLTNLNVGGLITLEYIFDHSPVAFTASIDSAKKVITVIPNSDFTSGRVVYVAIESVEDFSDNGMGATSGTFSVNDSTAPTLEFSPADSSNAVSLDSNITLTFDEEIRLIDDSEVTDANVDSLITLKDANPSGSNISFDATIDSAKKEITINLNNDLSSDQIVYVAIGATVEDSYNNAISSASATFTSADSLPPTVTIEAVITASIATDSDITFTFSEPVRNLDDTALTNANVGSLLALKDTDANGFDIPFSATINSAKTIMTINPTSNFTSKQNIYAALGPTVEDYADNAVPASSQTFVAEYLASSLSNPFSEKDFVGLIESQAETSKLFMRQSANAVLERMEWLRRHRKVKNLSNQGIRIKFINPAFDQIARAVQLPAYINQSGELLRNDWAIWSEGSVTIGKVNATESSSMKDIKSTGISLGVDKKIDEHRMLGSALRISNYDVGVGSSGNNLKTKAYSLSLYGTAPFNDGTYIDGIVGIGSLKIDQVRKHESGTLRGSRYGKQLFGSIVFSGEFEREEFTVSPYGRLNAGYSKLSSFRDSGTIAALTYKKQTLINGRVSLGLLMDHTIRIEGVSLKPNGRFEYGKEVYSSSDAVVSYLGTPGTEYTLKIDDEKTDNLRAGVGIDVETVGAWGFKANYERSQTIKSGYTNTVKISASYFLNTNTQYELSFVSDGSPNAEIEMGIDLGLISDWSLNASCALAQTENAKYRTTAQLRAQLSF